MTLFDINGIYGVFGVCQTPYDPLNLPTPTQSCILVMPIL